MRLNRAKFARARRVIEAAEVKLTDPKRTCVSDPLWRQDVVALRYVFNLAARASTEPWRKTR